MNSVRLVHGLFLLVLPAALFATGCGERSFSDIRPGLGSRGHYVDGVAFIRQTEFDCGPAALAGVMAFWGKAVALERITDSIYTPALKGTLPMDMERFAKDAGFRTESFSGSLERLRAAIRADVPVVCLLDLGFSVYRLPHYVTVTGFDDVNAALILHDGQRADRLMPYGAFEKAWARAGHWMLVIRP